jgi:hypothetical protein
LRCYAAGGWQRSVRGLEQDFTLDDAVSSNACSLDASMCVSNGIPFGCQPITPVGTVNSVETHKAPRLLEQDISLEDAIEVHACWLEANAHVIQ